MVTTGSGASDCLHIIQGTPVWSATAICAAHLTYGGPFSWNARSTISYSFSIYIFQFNISKPFKQFRLEYGLDFLVISKSTCDSMIGPPCEAYKFSDFIMFTIFVVKFCICTCTSSTSTTCQPVTHIHIAFRPLFLLYIP